MKLGAQCQMNTGTLLRYCEIVRPPAAMGIMVQERGFYERLRQLGVKPIYRHFPNEGWHDPEWHAGEFVSKFLKPETRNFEDLLAGGWVLGYNEYVHAAPHMSDEARDKADRFASTFIDAVHGAYDGQVHAVVLNLNTGHFREDVLCFQRTLSALDRCGVCLLGFHEYDWPTMDRKYREGLEKGNDGCWETLRCKVASKAIKKAGYENVRFAITECGLDAGCGGLDNFGWRKADQDYYAALWNYIRSLGWYIDALERDDDVDFALLFGAGLNPDWVGKGFEVPEAIWHWIANYKIYPEVR